jgi:nitrate reductase delta subunit
MMPSDRDLYELLADLLAYPTPAIAEQAGACLLALEPVSKKARDHVEVFSRFCLANPVSRLEELYTDTFDLQPLCCPYVGYHLFDEDRGRGMFMVRLQEHFRAGNHQLNGELPDHISVMLRSLSGREGTGETRELIGYCLIPAVAKMVVLFKGGDNPYRGVLEATRMVLEQAHGGS